MPGALAFEALAAAGGVAGHVVGHEDRAGLGFAGHGDDLGGGVAGADDQVGLALAELLAEVSQRVGQEAGPVRGRGDRGIHDEQRHHLAGAGAGLVQRRVVVQAQVTRENDDRGFHGVPPWPSA